MNQLMNQIVFASVQIAHTIAIVNTAESLTVMKTWTTAETAWPMNWFRQ